MVLLMSVCLIACSNDSGQEPDISRIESVIIGEWDSEFNPDIINYDINDTRIEHPFGYFRFYSDGTGYEFEEHGIKIKWEWDVIDGRLYTNGDKYSERYDVIAYGKDVIYLLRLNHYEAVVKLVRRNNRPRH